MELTVKKAQTFWEKTRGLLGENKPYPLWLQTRFGIHTFGMKFPIDVIILDDNFLVRKVKKHLKPNRIFLWDPHYQHVIELPSGQIDTLQIKLRSLLSPHVL